MPLPIEELFTNPKYLMDWLKTKPADEKYDYNNGDECALTRFLQENGYPKARAGAYSVYIEGWDESVYIEGWDEVDNKMRLPLGFDNVARGNGEDNTFGAMLRRAEEQWPVVG